MEESGSGGMLGGDLLRRYWGRGAVREQYFRSRVHWDKVAGYMAKHGYFEKGRKYQGRLPEWAVEMGVRIKRVNKSLKRVPKRSGTKKNEKIVMVIMPKKRTNYERIKECGKRSEIYIRWRKSEFGGHAYNVPYWDLRRLKGQYVKGLGYVLQMSRKFFLTFFSRYREFEESVAFTVIHGLTLKMEVIT
jgi:hypothetical protein